MSGGHSGAILGTSPSAKPCATAMILMPGLYSASPVAAGSQAGSGLFPEQQSQQQQLRQQQEEEFQQQPHVQQQQQQQQQQQLDS
jgi:hypothetical protein